MNFTEIAQTRQSCRNFDPTKSVEKEKIIACLEAARLAPSACNSQPWHFTVCTGENSSLIAQIATSTQEMGMNKFASDVHTFVIVSEGTYNVTALIGTKVKRQDFRSHDIGIASAYFTAEAQTQGLSTCMLGWFDEKALKKLTGIETRIRLLFAVGYAKTDSPIREKKRKPLEEITNWI